MEYRFRNVLTREEKAFDLSRYRELFCCGTTDEDLEEVFTVVHYDRDIGYVLRPLVRWSQITEKSRLTEMPKDHFKASFFGSPLTERQVSLARLMKLRCSKWAPKALYQENKEVFNHAYRDMDVRERYLL